MSDKIKVAIGVLVILLLLGAIVFVYLSPKTFFSGIGVKNKEVKKKETIVLSEDYKDPEKYTEISVNDIVDGTILKREMAQVKSFDEDAIPLKYVRKNDGYNESRLLIDDPTWLAIKANPSKSPFRNLYFYKIKSGDIWYTILGQQVRNSDGTTSFLHFLVHKGTEIYTWGRNSFAVEPFIIIPDAYFDEVGQRDFFSADNDYYKNGGKVDSLVNSWLKTGVVPDDLQKQVLMMSIKW